jgi:predicted transcriptional regulator
MCAIMTLLESIERVRGLSWPELEVIAKGAGVPFHTLRKIASGETRDPRVSTIAALQQYLTAADAARPATHPESEAA